RSVPLRSSPIQVTASTALYTLSLHDALPIFDLLERRDDRGDEHRRVVVLVAEEDGDELPSVPGGPLLDQHRLAVAGGSVQEDDRDRKSTRLNSSHDQSSYAGFCLKKKNPKQS